MKIAIDPGHGQDNAKPNTYDSGAVGFLNGHKYEEATIALAYGLKLRERLVAGGHQVFMTRDDAEDSTPVGRRAQRAKDAGCEMFISLHLNSYSGAQANGIEVEWRSETKDKPLADALLNRLLKVTGLGDHHNDQRLDLAVLKFSPGPAVLIELGFITNERDLRTLLEEQMQDHIVGAIAEVVTGTKSVQPKPEVTVTPPEKAKPTDAFVDLGRKYAAFTMDYPALREVTFAQWALESGWGSSGLARIHHNYAGLKWRGEMAGYAVPVEYTAHDGTEQYCAFTDLEAFVRGFWKFMSRAPYKDLAKHAGSPEAYLEYILPNYTPSPGYRKEVLEVMPRAAQYLKGATAPTPGLDRQATPSSSLAPENTTEFEARIDRIEKMIEELLQRQVRTAKPNGDQKEHSLGSVEVAPR